MNVWHSQGLDCDKISSSFYVGKQNIFKVSHGLWLDSITPGIKGGVYCFFSLHDSVYGVQYNMYSWFFFFKKSYFS